MEENLIQNDRPDPNPAPTSEPFDILNETKEPERNQRHSSTRHIRQSIDNSGHILEVLRAAMPYIDSRRQNTMETLMKATDLIHTTRTPKSSGELSAASLNMTPANIEGMLCSVREVGSMNERDMIDKMLNFFKAKKFYQTYKIFNQNKDLLKTASLGDGNYSNNPNFMEALKGFLPPDQASNLENMQTILNAMNAMNAMGMNTSWGNNNRQSNNPTGSTYTPYSNYNNASPGDNDARPDSYQQFPKTPMKAKVAPQPVNHYNPPTSSKVPNYTYQMSGNSSYQNSPAIDSNYMNQFAPSIPEPEINQAKTQPNTFAPSSTQSMDPAATNNLYQNITNLYHTLSAAGLANGTSQSNNTMPSAANPANQNNMLSVISALANSGLLNGNFNPAQSTNNNRSNPALHSQAQAQAASIPTNPSTMKSMPIPTASNFQANEQPSRNRTSKNFNPDDLYAGLSNFRNRNDLNRSAQPSSDVVEAASLEP